MGTRAPTARFAESAGAHRLLLAGEALVLGCGVIDARPEFLRVLRVLSRSLRELLAGPDVAGSLRARAVLRRWARAASDRALPPGQVELRDRMRFWDLQEGAACAEIGRSRRFELRELSSPPLAPAWLNSHQDIKFPGDPVCPAPFPVSVNEDADRGVGLVPAEGILPADPPAHWIPGLPRFWLSIGRRSPPGAPSTAVRQAALLQTRLAWISESTRPWQGALGRNLPHLYRGSLPLQLFSAVTLPAGAVISGRLGPRRAPGPPPAPRPSPLTPSPTPASPAPAPTPAAAPAPSPSAEPSLSSIVTAQAPSGGQPRPPARPPAGLPSTLNLEGFACRLRGHVGGSFTQMLHVHPHFASYFSHARIEQALRERGAIGPDVIAALADVDFDVDALPDGLSEHDQGALSALLPLSGPRPRLSQAGSWSAPPPRSRRPRSLGRSWPAPCATRPFCAPTRTSSASARPCSTRWRLSSAPRSTRAAAPSPAAPGPPGPRIGRRVPGSGRQPGGRSSRAAASCSLSLPLKSVPWLPRNG